jgi:molybdopterin converting factor small subunit
VTVRVRLFAAYREAAGAGEIELPLTPGLTVGQLWGRLLARHPDLGQWAPSAAVNRSYAALTAPLADGDEVAFLPPVSGG